VSGTLASGAKCVWHLHRQVDAVVATLAEQLDLPVWTFDHHFDVMACPVWRGQAG
jgi:hypothetical protein